MGDYLIIPRKQIASQSGITLSKYLTLRSQASRVELAQSGISGMNGVQVQFGFESKVIELGVAFEQFQFDIPAQGSREMMGLGR